MVLGSRRVNIIWKSFQNYLGFILELLEIDLESFFKQKVNILNIFLYISSGNEEKMKSQLQISSSGNESRPGTHFKMCSRSRQYQRFEYHQKSLSQNRSYRQSKYDFLILGQIWVGPNSDPVCCSPTPYRFEQFLKCWNC